MSVNSNKFSGIVVYDRLGKQVIRTLPFIFKDANTVLQQNERSKYKTAINYCKLFINVFKAYWTNPPTNQSYWNAALGDCLRNAMTQWMGNWSITNSSLKLTSGDLWPSDAFNFYSNYTNAIYFNSNDNTGQGNAEATDYRIKILYFPGRNKLFVLPNTAFTRNIGYDATIFTENMIGELCHCWVFWVRPDLSLVSNSVYVGQTTIIP
jgi:hypothetical protein